MTDSIVIFDLGGTLVSGPPKGPATQIAKLIGLSREHKHALHAALMSTPFTVPDEVTAFVHNLSGNRSPSVGDAVRQVWADQEIAATPLDGAHEALTTLHDAGLRLAVISNIWPPYLHSIRAHFQDFFNDWAPSELQLFSCYEHHPKPSQVMFERALKAAEVDPDQAVMIGDTYAEDIAPAAALGIRTLWLMHRPERELQSLTDVINGDREAPTQAATSIARVTPDLIDAILRRQ